MVVSQQPMVDNQHSVTIPWWTQIILISSHQAVYADRQSLKRTREETSRLVPKMLNKALLTQASHVALPREHQDELCSSQASWHWRVVKVGLGPSEGLHTKLCNHKLYDERIKKFDGIINNPNEPQPSTTHLQRVIFQVINSTLLELRLQICCPKLKTNRIFYQV